MVLLILAAVLVAAWFRGTSYFISDRFNVPEWLSFTIVIVATLGVVALISWTIGSKISEQFSELQESLPALLNNAREFVSQFGWGERLISETNSLNDGQTGEKLFNTVRKFFKTSFGIIGDTYIVLFLGAFFTAQPRLYRDGILALVPKSKTSRAKEVLSELGVTLRNWLAGKLFAMVIEGILTYIGLRILGVPMALSLAVIAAILCFIPNFGPVLAMIPAVLVGASEGMDTVLFIIILYVIIQAIESNILTPLIQLKLIRIPPALIIIAQVVMGVFTGALGIILATPFVAILMVLVQQLYIKDSLGKSLEQEKEK